MQTLTEILFSSHFRLGVPWPSATGSGGAPAPPPSRHFDLGGGGSIVDNLRAEGLIVDNPRAYPQIVDNLWVIRRGGGRLAVPGVVMSSVCWVGVDMLWIKMSPFLGTFLT